MIGLLEWFPFTFIKPAVLGPTCVHGDMSDVTRFLLWRCFCDGCSKLRDEVEKCEMLIRAALVSVCTCYFAPSLLLLPPS